MSNVTIDCNLLYRLAAFVDKFGHRLAGSEQLEKSIDYIIDLTQKEHVYNISTEDVEVNILIEY